ncbi:hypothetical protein [Flavobacterium sp. UBA7682]|uniref:hypothetical protein n=1 Tax=Flavobacterium sp. UBA7682 TaxID=1946560 RepID=UPI0025B91EC9|nr:hypothetical protein [Flavobacterium sp. UBA7682]
MKITYLFGAGASCEALPIVNQIPKRLDGLIEKIKKNEFEFTNQETYNEINKSKILELIVEDLRWLRDSTENHASIDTLAKKLYLKEKRSELNKLKSALSIFLILEQIINPADKRYDAFFASILDEHYSELPTNIRILSWNYDSQFEKSYAEYTDSPEWDQNRTSLRVTTKSSTRRPRADGFNIIKLNGSHNVIGDAGHSVYEFCPTGKGYNKQIMESILKTYMDLKKTENRLYSGLSFAWEKEENIIEFAKQQTIDTEILVVIGYSFPYFNRNVDRAIIKNMEKLSKVYFQSPEAAALKERFATIRTDIKDLVSISDVKQFYLPDEL